MEQTNLKGSERRVLAIDIGGSHVKIRSSAGGPERKADSGKEMTAA